VPLVVVVGLGWGDEGKGKIVDFLSEGASMVARFSGGANAGHSVEAAGRKVVLHQVPTGLLRDSVTGVIGSGCVIAPVALEAEMAELSATGLDVLPRLRISPRAHLVHPCYAVSEARDELSRGGSAIGTTGRGIGPSYERKFARRGLRLEDAADPSSFRERTLGILDEYANEWGGIPEGLPGQVDLFVESSLRLAACAADVGSLITSALSRGSRVIAEGAQGTLLDPDAGTYPYVTCGSCVSGAACTSLGIGPSRVDEVVGVVKAYSTRVGAGPFPTELEGSTADEIRTRGNEYGATTGRPRRVGWFDAVLASYSVAVNGCDSLALTLTDVLGCLPEIRVATGYRGMEGMPYLPLGQGLSGCIPVYESLPGWLTETRGTSRWSDLPPEFRRYVERLEALAGCPVGLVSTGPRREETIWKDI